MTDTDIKKKLEQAERDFQADFAKIKEKLSKKTEGLLDEAFVDLANAFDSAAVLYRAIPKEYREQALRSPTIKKILNTLGLRPLETKTKIGRVRRSRVTDEEILDLLKSDSVTTSGIMMNLGFSAVTAAKRLDALLKAKKVTMEKKGTYKYWKKA